MKHPNKSFPASNKIIDKLKMLYNLSSDAALAKMLNIRPNTLSIWKTRDSVDLKKIFELCPQLDFNWLLDDGASVMPALKVDAFSNKAIQDIFNQYLQGRPISIPGRVHIIDINEIDRYPLQKKKKAYVHKLPSIDAPECFGWPEITRIIKTKDLINEQWTIASYVEEPWHIDRGNKLIVITNSLITSGELLTNINRDTTSLQIMKQSGQINNIKIKEIEEVWLAIGQISKLAAIKFNDLKGRIENLENHLLSIDNK